jgi:dUTPase
MQAIEGSASFDLPTDIALILSPKVQCYKITTGVYGPLSLGTLRILGRSGFPFKDLLSILVYYMDGDSKEEIKIMAYVRK